MNTNPDSKTAQSEGTTSELVTLDVEGMTCASCVFRVEKALKAIPEVDAVSVNLATEKASIRFTAKQFISSPQDPSRTELAIAAVRKCGYEAHEIKSDDFSVSQKKINFFDSQSIWPVLFSALFSLPLILPMLSMLAGIHFEITGWLQLLLATPVQFIFGARFYVSAYKALKARSGNMDLLVSIGTSAAYGLSLYGVFQGQGHALYFEASAVVITFVLLGKWLEARAKFQTTEAIRALQAMWPQTARVIQYLDHERPQERQIPLSQVFRGDQVVVLPGERIPVDGEILEGGGSVDESMLSGEALPLEKQVTSKVTGGSINGESRLVIQATSVGVESTLAKMIRLVENAQAQKAPIQRLVDQVSAWFVPLVILIALLNFGLTWWFLSNIEIAIIRSVSILVIACPCALGLATPAAMMVGTGIAAKRGILIKDAQMLELTHRLNVVIFDKTGTLTQGHPKLLSFLAFLNQQVLPVDSAQSKEALGATAALQIGSEHPLAKAVMNALKEASFDPNLIREARQIKAIPGVGVQAQMVSGLWQGQTLSLVSHRSFTENHSTETTFQDLANPWLIQGRTLSWLLNEGGEILAMLVFGDELKSSSKPAIQELEQMGIKTVMLSGDHPQVAQYIATQLGIQEFHAGMLPQDKALWVSSYKRAHPTQIIAMVGDGINDAPALACADVGMAMASGTDVAMHAAGITLMRGDLNLIGQSIRLSQKTWQKIQQNLFWAFFFNIIGIPLAGLGYLTPVIAGAAMAFSSVTVLSNALLLKRAKNNHRIKK